MPDAREEGLAMVREGFARREASWRRENPGKVRFYLVNAPDDPPTFSDEGQVALRGVVSALRENHIDADTPFMTLDAIDAVGGYTGEIAVFLKDLSPLLAGIVGAWVQSKVGRKVRLKDGDIEVEASTEEQALRLHQLLLDQRQARSAEPSDEA
ncbi:hypothetical protein [Caballeronia sp. 15711]|uniref:hypothetical protein n=1 Tax=Caballeronia sp. 15711 TaxID=3391029 RepID=UPI0039E246D8